MAEQIITAEDWSDLDSRLADHAGIHFKEEYVRALLTNNPSVADDIREFGTDTDNGGRVLSLIAEDLLGRNWPNNGEEIGEGFFESLRGAAASRDVVDETARSEDEPETPRFVYGLSREASNYIATPANHDHVASDIDYFVKKHWLALARIAWKGFQSEGRGAIVVEIPCPLDEFRAGPEEGFIAPVTYAGENGAYFAENQALLEKLRDIYVLDRYDPELSVVVIFIGPDGKEGKCLLKLVSACPRPKEAAAILAGDDPVTNGLKRLAELSKQARPEGREDHQ